MAKAEAKAGRQSDDKILEGMLKGEIKPYTVSKLVGGDEGLAARLLKGYVEQKYGNGAQLKHVGSTTMDFSDAVNRNIEMPIGAVQIPVGFVEIRINGEHVRGGKDGKSIVFLATTEGKLVAGVNRGASAINKSGGCTTRIVRNWMTRSNLVECKGIGVSREILRFAESAEGLKFLKTAFEKTTKHGKLVEVDAYTTGRLLYIVYKVDSKAAMGMNLVTIGAKEATLALLDHLKLDARLMSESGNMCTDKKPSVINALRGRGVSIVAEAVIPAEVIRDTFRSDAPSIMRLHYAKNYVGSSLAGSLAHNAHVANLLAATYIAYGQDPAQIVDGVVAYDDCDARPNGDLYVSVSLPALEVGTFGGGTRREGQQELLKCSGVYGEGDESGSTKLALAELIAAAVLAGELNLLGAQEAQELASSHGSLKRG